MILQFDYPLSVNTYLWLILILLPEDNVTDYNFK